MRLRESKEAYRRKLESKLQRNNVQNVWAGMKTLPGFKVRGDQAEGNLDIDSKLRFSSGPSAASTHGCIPFTPPHRSRPETHTMPKLTNIPPLTRTVPHRHLLPGQVTLRACPVPCRSTNVPPPLSPAGPHSHCSSLTAPEHA